MRLPEEFIKEVHSACVAVNVSADTVIAAMERLVGNDNAHDYWVWHGPGPTFESLTLDLMLIGDRCLYGYELSGQSALEICIFLDTVHSVALTPGKHEVVAYTLLLARVERTFTTRVFGREGDYEKLNKFRNSVIQGVLRAKHSKEGS